MANIVRDPRQDRPWRALSALVLGFFMIMIDTTIVVIANPTIQTKLGADTSAVIWVTSAYLLTYSVPLLVTGRLGDRFGRAASTSSGWCSSRSPRCSAASPRRCRVRDRQPHRRPRGAGPRRRADDAAVDGGHHADLPAGAARRGDGPLGSDRRRRDARRPDPRRRARRLARLEWIFFINVPIGVIGFISRWCSSRSSRRIAIASTGSASSSPAPGCSCSSSGSRRGTPTTGTAGSGRRWSAASWCSSVSWSGSASTAASRSCRCGSSGPELLPRERRHVLRRLRDDGRVHPARLLPPGRPRHDADAVRAHGDPVGAVHAHRRAHRGPARRPVPPGAPRRAGTDPHLCGDLALRRAHLAGRRVGLAAHPLGGDGSRLRIPVRPGRVDRDEESPARPRRCGVRGVQHGPSGRRGHRSVRPRRAHDEPHRNASHAAAPPGTDSTAGAVGTVLRSRSTRRSAKRCRRR